MPQLTDEQTATWLAAARRKFDAIRKLEQACSHAAYLAAFGIPLSEFRQQTIWDLYQAYRAASVDEMRARFGGPAPRPRSTP